MNNPKLEAGLKLTIKTYKKVRGDDRRCQPSQVAADFSAVLNGDYMQFNENFIWQQTTM